MDFELRIEKNDKWKMKVRKRDKMEKQENGNGKVEAGNRIMRNNEKGVGNKGKEI